MIKIRTIDVFGFDGALYGIRMPFESHEKSDSYFCTYNCGRDGCPYTEDVQKRCANHYLMGEKDMGLCKKLIKGGSEHRKFLRMVHVQAEVNAPRYWWTELDTYKFVEKNSSSTMHLITKRKLSHEDFSFDSGNCAYNLETLLVGTLNRLIDEYNRETDKAMKDSIFKQIKTYLPESFMQRRVIDTNYEELLNIYRQRKNHRLAEWHTFCSWVEGLPYIHEFISALEEKV